MVARRADRWGTLKRAELREGALDALGAAEVRGSKLSEFRDNFQKMKTLWTFSEILNKYFSKPCEDALKFLKRNNLIILPFIISFASSLITMTGDESPVAGESEPGYDPSFSSGLRHPRQGGRSVFFFRVTDWEAESE